MAASSMERDVRSLIETVQNLSDVIITTRDAQRNAQEVSRVFRGSTTTTSSSNVGSSGSSGPSATSITTSTARPPTAPISRFRRLNNNRRLSQGFTGRRRTPKPPANSVFMCDIVLLSGPMATSVPRQGTKLILSQRGHVLTGCRFNKAMTEIDVETTIIEAFGDLIPAFTEIEILHSVHHSLVKPALVPGQQGVDGTIIHRLFKAKNKPVYVRPSIALLHELEQENEEEENEEEESKDVESKEEERKTEHSDGEDLMNAAFTDRSTSTITSTDQDANTVEDSSSPSTSSHDLTVNPLVEHLGTPDANTVDNGSPSTSSHDLTVNGGPEVAIEGADYAMVVDGPNTEFVEALLSGAEEIVRINRNNVLRDMIMIFKKPMILYCALQFTIVDVKGEDEVGIGSGVTREVLSIFWREFNNSLTIGASEKVPHIRHDYQRSEWESASRILVFGFIRERYFPIALSRAFIASCLLPEDDIPADWLLSAFYDYMPSDESETVKKALASDSEDTSGNDELIDVLSSYKCFRIPSKENLPTILKELSHQELIQKAKYISSAWLPIVKVLKPYKEFQSITDLTKFYDNKRPTTKKVCKLFVANPVSDGEKEVFDHLKRFVKSLDSRLLGAFLQFITGSNVITVEKIDVGFSKEIKEKRLPVAHTCGPLLVIPSTYESYNEVSEAFMNILGLAANWGFSII